MKPFSILCTTCQARLRVRDRSAIGQILACPKCGSMVLVEQPHDDATPGELETRASSGSDSGGKSDSDAACAQASPSDAEKASGRTPPAVEPARPQLPETPADEPHDGERPARKFKFREDFAPTDAAPEQKGDHIPATTAPPKQAGVTAVRRESEVPAADMPTPAATKASPAVLQRQQWILLGAAAVFGVVLALLLVAIVASRRSPPPRPSETVAEADDPAAPATDNRDPDDTAASKDSDKGSAGDDSDTGAPNPADQTSDDTGAKTTPPVDDAGAATEPPTPDDASALPPDLADPATPVPPTTTDVADDQQDAATPDMGESTEEPSAPASDGAGSVEGAGEEDAAVLTQLAFPLLELEFGPRPLADFAQFVTNITLLPVTLDVEALRTTNTTPDSSVEVRGSGLTVEQALRAALAPLRLRYVARHGQLIILPEDFDRTELWDREYDVSDLAEEEPAVQALREQIRSLIAAGTWSDDGSGVSVTVTERALQVRQTAINHVEIARFLDRLRATRGLLPRSDLPSDLLKVKPAFLQVSERLKMPVGVAFTEPTPLQQILDYLQGQWKGTAADELPQLRLLVDWQSLAEREWHPGIKLTLSLPEQPVHEFLNAWLAPQELDYRVYDSRTLVITSRSTIASQPEVELYPLRQEPRADVKQLIAELQTHVGAPFFGDEGTQGTLLYDEASHCLLVALPQPQQRLVAQWLQQKEQVEWPEE